jgi:hypothetical protein
MNPAVYLVFFFVLSAFAFLYAIDLLIFLFRENRFYEKEKTSPHFYTALEKKMKHKKNPQKKNYLLFLYSKSFYERGESARAESLFHLVRPDPILGLRKTKK